MLLLAIFSLLLVDLPYLSQAKNSPNPDVAGSPTQPLTRSDRKTRTGRVSLKSYQPLKPASNPHLAKLLKGYTVKPTTFDWKMKHIRRVPRDGVWSAPTVSGNQLNICRANSF